MPQNPHIGWSLDEFLAEEGILEDVSKRAAARVIEVLLEHGDALNHVREIDHFSYFPSIEGRSRFVERCIAAGLKLRSLHKCEDSNERFAAVLYHDDIPDEQVLAKMHEMLSTLAELEGGRYDGWETQLIA
jgi:hypothetical protein